MHKIKAAVLRRKGGPLKIESLELDGPRDDEVLVRIVAAGICRTDIDLIDDWNESSQPVVLGHEGAGVVEQFGRKVKSVKRGDHVLLSYQSCGRCRSCRKERPMDCNRFWEVNFGFQRLDGSNALQKSGVGGHFFGQSSFASHSLATERNLVKVSKNLPLEILAPLGCGMQTGAGTIINSLNVPAGRSVAVFGTGAVGLAAIMAARIIKANPIIGVDIIPMRLTLALELGATHTINSRQEDVSSHIAAITGSGVDYVLEITGAPEMFRLAVDVLNPKGSVAIFSGASVPASLPGGRKAYSIVEGDAVPQRFIPKLISLYREGRFPFDRLIKHYDFKKIHSAITAAKRGAVIKPVLRMTRQ